MTHDQTRPLAPALLLSMPQLNDPNFKQSVVLLCEFSENGAFGLVLNRPTGTPAVEAVQLDGSPVAGESTLELWVGGPVEPQRGWILLGERPESAESLEICAGLYLSTSPALLRQLLQASGGPRARLLTGYAGWAPGQLDSELAESAWLIADVDVGLIFDSEAGQMWEAALRRLGADPASLQMSHGVH